MLAETNPLKQAESQTGTHRMSEEKKITDAANLSKEDARMLIKAIEDVEREEAAEEERARNERGAA